MRANSSCATPSRRSPVRRQFSFAESVQQRAIADEIRISLTSPFDDAPYGSKVGLNDIESLVKHIKNDDNRIALTIGKLTHAMTRQLKLPRDIARRPALTWDAIICAQYGLDEPLSFDRLQEIETELQCLIDPQQVAYMLGDHSTQRKRAMLESFRRMRSVIDRIIAWLEHDLFGGKIQ